MLKKSFRLKRAEIPSLLTKGEFIKTPTFNVRKNTNSLKNDRFCVIISRKCIKSAVKRNYERRRTFNAIGEILKEKSQKHEITHKDFALIAKIQLPESSYEDLKTQLTHIIN